jgi:hypothetical protein
VKVVEGSEIYNFPIHHWVHFYSTFESFARSNRVSGKRFRLADAGAAPRHDVVRRARASPLPRRAAVPRHPSRPRAFPRRGSFPRQHARRGAPESALPACPRPGTRAVVRPHPARRRTELPGRSCPSPRSLSRSSARASPIRAAAFPPTCTPRPARPTEPPPAPRLSRRGELQSPANHAPKRTLLHLP